MKSALGLDEAKYLGFGAAPLHPNLRKFFLSLNFPLFNVFGMTETTCHHSGTSALDYNPKCIEDFLEVGIPMPGS
jgi:long-subunit acyl-CoA synthetase (AMP-forming)